MTEPTLRIAQIVPSTEAEGPGRRFTVWFQGCPLRCPGCCNPEFLSFDGGEAMPLSSVLAMISDDVEGITLLGGEPLSHAVGAAALAEAARDKGLTVMVFTGHLREQAETMDDDVRRLLSLTDILVDGPYLRDQPDTARRWIGSTNQRIHFLTSRYRADDSCWRSPNTLEIRVRGNEVSVNGFPAKQAVGLWKRPRVAR